MENDNMTMFERMVKDAVGKRVNRSRTIRLKCLDCCNYQSNEVKLCTSIECPLWRYRMGKEERDELYYQAHQSKEEDKNE